MNVYRWIFRSSRLRCISKIKQNDGQNQHIQTVQPTKKTSKIKQAIKNIITQLLEAIGKTVATAVLTSLIIALNLCKKESHSQK